MEKSFQEIFEQLGNGAICCQAAIKKSKWIRFVKMFKANSSATGLRLWLDACPRQHNPVDFLLHYCILEIWRMTKVQAKGEALIQRLRLMKENRWMLIRHAWINSEKSRPETVEASDQAKVEKALMVTKTWMTISGEWRREMVRPWSRKHWAIRLEKGGICQCYGGCWRSRSPENSGL